MAKLIAVFGTVSNKTIKAFKKAGFVVGTTDSQAEAQVRADAKEHGAGPIVHQAAWKVMNHVLSEVGTSMRDGEPNEYNKNGGYTRDAILATEAHAVLVGSGVGPRRMQLIHDAADEAGRPFRRIEPETPADDYDPETTRVALEALPF